MGSETARMRNKLSRSKISRPDRDIYHQFVGSLVGGDFKFSKRNFKKFIPWVFKYFPRVSCDFVHMGSF